MEEVERILKETNLYRVLGVTVQECEEGERPVKQAFHRIAKVVHPDRCDHPRAAEAFQRASYAYEVLRDPQKREQYDQFGEEGKPEPRPRPERRRQPREQENFKPWQACWTMVFLILMALAPNVKAVVRGWSGAYGVNRNALKGMIVFEAQPGHAQRQSQKYKVQYYVPSWWMANHVQGLARREWEKMLGQLDKVADEFYEEELEINCELEKNRLGREGNSCAKRKRVIGL